MRNKSILVRSLLWAGGGVALGLLIGLVLGWWVWPVRWTDTDPSDLRAEHQVDYVRMTADSLAVTGDAELAGRRLYELTEQDEDWRAVADLIEKTAAEHERQGDVAIALRLRRLAEILELPRSHVQPEMPQPKRGIALPQTGVLLIGIGAALVALAAVAWLALRMTKRAAPFRRRRPDAPSAPDLVDGQRSLAPSRDGAGEWSTRWESLPRSATSPSLRPADADKRGASPISPMGAAPFTRQQVVPIERDDVEQTLLEALGEDDLDLEEIDELADDAPLSEPAPTLARTLKSQAIARPTPSQSVWGSFETEYHLGDDDFYYAFTVESPEREFVGQCGIVIGDVLNTGQPQRVDAFEVWLFETQGGQTLTEMLVSPYAYADEAQRAKLGRRGALHEAQPGATLTIDGTHLRLTVTVLDCVFLPLQQMREAVFSQLAVQMVVEPLV